MRSAIHIEIAEPLIWHAKWTLPVDERLTAVRPLHHLPSLQSLLKLVIPILRTLQTNGAPKI